MRIQMFDRLVLLLMLCLPLQAATQEMAQEETTLFVAGSTTVSGLVEASAQPFAKRTGIKLIVRPIGTEKGIVAIAEGIVDVGMASRYLRPAEADRWPALKQVTVGQDALAVMVNRNNPIAALSTEQLAQVYSGEIRNWAPLLPAGHNPGSFDTSIDFYSKNSGHGTFDAFVSLLKLDAVVEASEQRIYFKRTGENRLYSKVGAAVYDQAREAAANVQRIPSAIAYDSLGAINRLLAKPHADHIKILPINGVSPTLATISNGSYPLVRPMNLLYRRDRQSQKVQRYLDFLLSEEGQQLAEQLGYLPVR